MSTLCFMYSANIDYGPAYSKATAMALCISRWECLTCTASASRSTPRSIAARPSTPNRISFPEAMPRRAAVVPARILEAICLVVLLRAALERVLMVNVRAAVDL